MSNNVNSQLFDRAREAIEYCAGKPQAEVIQMHMDDNDLESLELAVREIEKLMFEREFSPQEVEQLKSEFDWSDHERELQEGF